ncbi:MAG: hypothetical protein GY870_13135 [archaeon]|nr:hypothetical protein [archaeon]
MSDIFGIGATNIIDRALAARGKLNKTPIHFNPCQSLDNAGTLLMLPFLIENGLLSYQKFYEPFSKIYYDLDFIIMVLSFMFLCRIKKVGQLKNINSGELGKLLGSDRVPEAKCFYKKISQISSQKKAMDWNKELAKYWIKNDNTMIFYVDGHVQVYHGTKALLGKKHISRQRLCLPGVMQYWINNSEGLPYLYVTGEVNEKLQEMIETRIAPLLVDELAQKVEQPILDLDPYEPRFTLVFDRECSSPKFFQELWYKYRIAILTYKKNVKDKWPEEDFSTHKILVDGDTLKMDLCEKKVVLDGISFREIRKKSEDGHQTSVITTNKKLSIVLVALYMFARWSQENYFRYMRQEYDLDRLFQSIVTNVDKDFLVVNPAHTKLTYKIKTIREKITRRKAKLYQLTDENINTPLEKTAKTEREILKIKKELEKLKNSENSLIENRKKEKYKIKIKDMPEEYRYTKLDDECKHFMSIIKMICYRAETSFINLIPQSFKRKSEEKRDFSKRCVRLKGDLIPNYQENILTIKLYTMSTQRENLALKQIIDVVNNSETKFPGTDLVLRYENATKLNTASLEF